MRKEDFKQFLRVEPGDEVSIISLKSKYNLLAAQYNLTIIQGLMTGRSELLDQMKQFKVQIDKHD